MFWRLCCFELRFGFFGVGGLEAQDGTARTIRIEGSESPRRIVQEAKCILGLRAWINHSCAARQAIRAGRDESRSQSTRACTAGLNRSFNGDYPAYNACNTYIRSQVV